MFLPLRRNKTVGWDKAASSGRKPHHLKFEISDLRFQTGRWACARWRKLVSTYVLLTITLVVGGCFGSTAPPTLAELRDGAVADSEAARQARLDHDAAAARAASDRAQGALQAAEKLPAMAGKDVAPPAEQPDALLAEIKSAAKAADAFAGLAEEDQRLAEMTSGWTAKAYRASRGVALSASLQGLSLAADQAGRSDLAALPKGVQDSAQQAARLAEWATGREKLAGGETDWPGVSQDLSAMSQDLPPSIALFLAVAHVMTGHSQLALYEVSMIDPAGLRSDEQRWQAALVRGVVYSSNGLRRLGVETLQEAAVAHQGDPQYAPAVLAGVHLCLAYLAFDGGDYQQADLEIARSLTIWPNNPVAVFLTGERLAASGEYEQAAQSLEGLAAGTQQEWLAQRVALRAREIRDSRGEAKPILHDAAFVRDLGLHFLSQAADHAQDNAAESWRNLVDSARDFGGGLLE